MEWLNEILEEIEPLNKAIMNQKYSEIFTVLLLRKTADDLQHEMNQIKDK